ncbi:hypothetical protein, partial [Paenacidovorax caeni]|uniref:hypothetical protein n=1 Tax=Paenacidovorax caeni TaxID=343013 RepID=UPI001F40D2F7
FRLLVVSQQARQQFFGYVVFLGTHGAYGQADLRRRWIDRLHKILHTLPQYFVQAQLTSPTGSTLAIF